MNSRYISIAQISIIVLFRIDFNFLILNYDVYKLLFLRFRYKSHLKVTKYDQPGNNLHGVET